LTSGPATPVDGALELLAARHLRIEPPFGDALSGLAAKVDALAGCIGAEVLRTWQACGRRTADLVLSSTVLSGAISGDAAMAERLLRGVEAACGVRPLAILHSYMCTGWGFGLRFFARHTAATHLSVVVVDVDVHNFRFRREHAPIGRFGFGITTAVLGLPAAGQAAVACGGPYEGSAFNELIRAMKQLYAQGRPALGFVPYLRDEMVQIVRRVLGEDRLAPNRYADYGHCFGADTWIGVIEELRARPAPAPYAVAMGAIAFNGYFCVCRVNVGPSTCVSFDRIDGTASSLAAAAAGAPPILETEIA
jgi:hypothetical protein